MVTQLAEQLPPPERRRLAEDLLRGLAEPVPEELPPPEVCVRVKHGSPRIAGTRITVYDVMDYYTQAWPSAAIAVVLGVSVDEVRAAIRYIEEHREEVRAEYQEILERAARGNPPELQARLDAIHARGRALREARRKHQGPEANGAGDPGGQ